MGNSDNYFTSNPYLIDFDKEMEETTIKYVDLDDSDLMSSCLDSDFKDINIAKSYPTTETLISEIISESDPEFRKEEEEESKKYDLKGDNRKWANWIITKFRPTEPVIVPGANNNNNHDSSLNQSILFIASSQIYNDQKFELERKGGKFTDPDFGPNFDSIQGFGEKLDRVNELKSKKITMEKTRCYFSRK